MGYWIIVILITLGGVLVLLAAASVTTEEEDGESSAAAQIESPVNRARRRDQSPRSDVRVVVFAPRHWTCFEHLARTASVPGTVVTLTEVDGSKLSTVAAAIDEAAITIRDSVVVVIAGVDDFLAGHTLDSTLEHLDRVLEGLSDLPAMAVVGSIPDLVSGLATIDTGVSSTSLSATVSVWNDAIADLARSYSAEFVDLGFVPVKPGGGVSGIAEMGLTIYPDRTVLTDALTPAIERAVDNVRSFRTDP